MDTGTDCVHVDDSQLQSWYLISLTLPIQALEFSANPSLNPASVSTPNPAAFSPDEHGSSDLLTGRLGLDRD